MFYAQSTTAVKNKKNKNKKESRQTETEREEEEEEERETQREEEEEREKKKKKKKKKREREREREREEEEEKEKLGTWRRTEESQFLQHSIRLSYITWTSLSKKKQQTSARESVLESTKRVMYQRGSSVKFRIKPNPRRNNCLPLQYCWT